jgi:hypothetical protein
MRRAQSECPIVIDLSGERAHRLAERLLAPLPDAATERLLEEIAALTGPGHRIAHDWDPATGRLTIATGRQVPGPRTAPARPGASGSPPRRCPGVNRIVTI